VSDEETLRRYPVEEIKNKFKDIDLIISCGDLSNDYLDFLFTALNKKLVYVNGNHVYNEEHDISFCVNLDQGKYSKVLGLGIVGFDGSPIYAMGRKYQYSEKEVFWQVFFAMLKLRCTFKKPQIVISHTPLSGIHEGKDPMHKGFKNYLKFLKWFKPKLWLHGHVHLRNQYEEQVTYLGKTKIINVFGYKIVELEC
jgi:Icc-related predicted phosphoesterase